MTHKAKHVHEARERCDYIRVPAAMALVQKAVDGVCEQARDCEPAHVAERELVVFLRLLLILA